LSNSKKDEAWERRNQIESLHASTPGGHDMHRLTAALGSIRDRESVLRIATSVLESPPVEKDGVYQVGNVEIRFDASANLSGLATTDGGVVIASVSADTD
jgi:hypothetical protein